MWIVVLLSLVMVVVEVVRWILMMVLKCGRSVWILIYRLLLEFLVCKVVVEDEVDAVVLGLLTWV